MSGILGMLSPLMMMKEGNLPMGGILSLASGDGGMPMSMPMGAIPAMMGGMGGMDGLGGLNQKELLELLRKLSLAGMVM